MTSKDQDAAAPPGDSSPAPMTPDAEDGWAFTIPNGYKPYSEWMKERAKPAAVPAPATASGLRYGRRTTVDEDLALLRSLLEDDQDSPKKSATKSN